MQKIIITQFIFNLIILLNLNADLRNIGSERQFFFDDNIIESIDNTKKRLNPAVKEVSNPIIKQDKPWEGTDIRIRWIFYDHRLKKFRLRYQTRYYYTNGLDEDGDYIIGGDGEGEFNFICEAFSEDGIHWEKPNLGLYVFEGSTDNNIVPDINHCHYVFEDLHETDPNRRYKGVYKGVYRENEYIVDRSINLAYSPDGYNWSEYENNPIINPETLLDEGIWGPIDFIWDPIRKTYAMHVENNLHTRSPYNRRSIGRAESPDMIHWTEPETLIVRDESDYPDTEFYMLYTTEYENWTIGLLWIFSTTNTTHHPEFVFSKDSINYKRDYRTPIIQRGDNGDFDSVSLYAMHPIVYKDEIFCYYYGTNWRSPEQLDALGSRATAGIGLAKIPLDGFVSLDGDRLEYSIVTTRTFTFEGSSLYLNIKAALQQWGAGPCDVRIEILDGRHIPIEGYSFEDSDIVTKTSHNYQITWNGEHDLSSLQGRPIRLKIYFKNAKIFAFQFK